MSTTATSAPVPYPLLLEGRLDPGLSRWLWLVKWVLAIPHLVVLAFLWIGFVAATVLAFFAILLTGRYPRALFDYDVGVLRWSWRVAHYSWSALGTDRYPPFSLDDVPDYPARLDVAYPAHLSRGLVLVKWWLLALPQYLVVGLLVGGGVWVAGRDDPWLGTASGGLIGVLVLVAAVVLAVTGRYPVAVYDLVLGLNRWVYRVLAYAALLTDVYPPFRLDLGGADPGRGAPSGPTPPEGGRPPHARPVTTSWTGGWIALLVVGALVAVCSLGLLGAGGTALWADQTQRDADGYVTSGSRTLSTTTYALVSEPLELTLDQPSDGFWLRQALGTVRVEVQGPEDQELFVGLARRGDVDRYLRGVSVDRVVEVTGDDDVTYDRRSGSAVPALPADQQFWAASASGPGTLVLDWDVQGGRWTIVVMDADAAAGVSADVRVGATLPWLLELGLALLAAGGVLLVAGTALMALAAGGARRPPPSAPEIPAARTPPTSSAPKASAPYAPGPLL